MFNKDLEGSVVERVYYTATVPAWLPVIGDPYESFKEAKDAVLEKIGTGALGNSYVDGLVETRAVFRFKDGTTLDTPVDRAKLSS